MTMLLFTHEGWDVVTAAWTVAAKPDRKVEICYSWGADGISWIDSATAVRRVTLDMFMNDFIMKVGRGGGIVDLR